MQRFARVPVHAASILKSAEAAIILERIRERTVGDQGAGQHTKASARFWKWSVPWMSLRQVQDKIKFLVKEGYAIRTQLYDSKGHRAESLYGITAKGLEILSIQVESDYIFPEIRKMHDKEVDAFLTRKSTLGQNPNAGISEPNAEILARETAHLVESYEVKTLSKDSSLLASLTGMSLEEQQPENEAASSTGTTPSQTLASPPDQPLSSRATPHSPLPTSPRKRFVPPTEEDWLAYCRLTFPTWKASAAQSVHAYYESVAWKGKVDWKACAKTCFHRAKQWDLQPAQAATSKPRETPAERRAREDREGREWFAAQGGVMPE